MGGARGNGHVSYSSFKELNVPDTANPTSLAQKKALIAQGFA